ncbi:type III secretory pathway component EscS [Inhella inkyongensis]|uniref:Type III secretory pathway component EscS n=1 Tax=Inhella inkyongensis TaxID=392593 RepID=A0A840S0R9_9BURK|nr:hypothetical protein [Inhella inkyongensis]MBB5203373.1 type III secretory pathway component EscS [Inhella inkyongensis]
MSTLNFALTLALAAIGPVLAISYLRPILLRLLQSQCQGQTDSADFWVRSAYVLAVCGTLLLALSFGAYRQDTLEALERALWLVAAGTFGTVAFITRQVWGPVRLAQHQQQLALQREQMESAKAQRAGAV